MLFHGSHDWSLKDDRGKRRAFADEMLHVFGTRPQGSSHDLLALARSAQVAGALPRMRIDCGTEDFLLDANRMFHAELQHLAIPHQYHESPGGHEWDYSGPSRTGCPAIPPLWRLSKPTPTRP